jgi:hypothetical protein
MYFIVGLILGIFLISIIGMGIFFTSNRKSKLQMEIDAIPPIKKAETRFLRF